MCARVRRAGTTPRSDGATTLKVARFPTWGVAIPYRAKYHPEASARAERQRERRTLRAPGRARDRGYGDRLSRSPARGARLSAGRRDQEHASAAREGRVL